AQLAKRQNDELAAMNEELHISLQRQEVLQRELMRLASTDELTGSLNRRQVINDGILEMERYRHTSAPFCVTVIDIDHFKSINDTFGHSVGDEVLRRLAKACQSKLRRFDVFGRLGGEEFCIIHHDTGIHGAKSAVERLLETIASLSLEDILDGGGITASMGICEVKSKRS
ncbi:MAG: GGDEF domain-containing protein, partial [Fimbriimonadaceae bacterium]|nr:GGDEF domain-containing protein [Fimbriimonadaceae bacterium]